MATKNLQLVKRGDIYRPLNQSEFDGNLDKVDAAFGTAPKDDDGSVNFGKKADINGTYPEMSVGEADTVDGKHAADFISSGGVRYLGMPYDLNDLTETGFFQGEGLGHAPGDNPGLFFITNLYEANGTYQTQSAVGLQSYTGTFTRIKKEEGWTNWKRLTTVDDIKVTGVEDTPTVATVLADQKIKSDVKISSAEGNGLEIREGGLFVSQNGVMLRVDGGFLQWSTNGTNWVSIADAANTGFVE